jgi:hypothetical protein
MAQKQRQFARDYKLYAMRLIWGRASIAQVSRDLGVQAKASGAHARERFLRSDAPMARRVRRDMFADGVHAAWLALRARTAACHGLISHNTIRYDTQCMVGPARAHKSSDEKLCQEV